MVSITCPCDECKYNGQRHKCKAKNINLKWRNVATVYEGRQDMWICDKYELSDEAKEMEEMIKYIMERDNNESK